MSAEDVSTHPSKQTANSIHPAHVEALVKHAVRNIKGGPELAKQIFGRKTRTTKRPDDIWYSHDGDHMKHFWG